MEDNSTANLTFSPPESSEFFDVLYICERVTGTLLIALALLLNALTITSLLRFRFLRKKQYIFLGNLAGLCLLACFQELILLFATDIPQCTRKTTWYVLGVVMETMLHGNMAWTFLFMAADKFLALFWPLNYPVWVTGRRIAGLVIIFWVFALLGAGYNAYEQFSAGLGGNVCVITSQELRVTDVVEFCSYLSAALCLVLLYGKVLQIAKRHQRIIAAQRIEVSHPDTWASSRETTKRPPLKQTRGSKVIIAVLTSYLLLWMPSYLVPVLQNEISYKQSAILFTTSNLLLISNLLVVNILYAWLNRDFRKAYRKLVSCDRMTRVSPIEDRCVTLDGTVGGHPITVFTVQVEDAGPEVDM